MAPQELSSRLGNVVSRWVPRSMLILSLVALLGCTIIWLILLRLCAEAEAVKGQGLAGLGPALTRDDVDNTPNPDYS